MKIITNYDLDYIRLDGSSITQAAIPFEYGIQINGAGSYVLFNDGTQALYYDDGGQQASFYPFDSGTSGMAFYATGKCKINVDAIANMSFLTASSEFHQPTTFDDTVSTLGLATFSGNAKNILGGSSSTGYVAAKGGYNLTATSNSGTSETDLHSYTLPAGLFGKTGSLIKFVLAGTTANTATNKTLRIRLGGTQIFTTATSAEQNGSWRLAGEIYRTGSNTQGSSIVLNSTGGKWAIPTVGIGTSSITDTSSMIFKITGQDAVGSNAVTCSYSHWFFMDQ